jgi:hypothetical protein
MLEWIPVVGSTRIIAMAYDPTAETIYVRFPNNAEWWYAGCPPHVWEEFSAEATSKGQFIARVLNAHANGSWAGG